MHVGGGSEEGCLGDRPCGSDARLVVMPCSCGNDANCDDGALREDAPGTYLLECSQWRFEAYLMDGTRASECLFDMIASSDPFCDTDVIRDSALVILGFFGYGSGDIKMQG